MRYRTRAAVLTATIALPLMAAAPAHAAPGDVIKGRTLLSKLTVRADSHEDTFEREKFGTPDWADRNDDCQNTRAEVLIAESTKKVTFTNSRKCTVKRGEWTSPYDDKVWTKASDVDIDHVVPLAEAWRSGAWDWKKADRVRHANDLRYSWVLDAVTDNVNSAKQDSDHAVWMPDEHKCRYVRRWVLIKYRWRLSVDPAEKAALVDLMSGDCGDLTLTVPHRALRS